MTKAELERAVKEMRAAGNPMAQLLYGLTKNLPAADRAATSEMVRKWDATERRYDDK